MQTEKFPMVGAPERAYRSEINRLPQCEGRQPLFDSVAVSFAMPSRFEVAL